MGMDPVTAGLIGKGIGGLFGLHSANKAYTRQKEMMQNAHQWEVQDLRKAGLNPILSATGGSGAGSFTAPAADIADFDLASAAAASKEIKIAQQNADTNKQNADTQEKVGESTIKSNTASANFASANTAYVNAQKVKAEIEANNLKDFLPRLYEAQIAKEIAAAQGIFTTSTAQAYKDYEAGALANKQAELTDFTLKSDLKYGKEGFSGWLSKFSDEATDNLTSSASGGSIVDGLERKFKEWASEFQAKYGPKGGE